MLTNLNRTLVTFMRNKSGVSLAQGDVVIYGSAFAKSFTTTTVAGYINGLIGVVLDPNGIANDAWGQVATAGWVPKINLASSANLYDFIKTHSVAKQGTPHAAPMQAGDFAQVLGTGTNPEAVLFEKPNQLSTDGGSYFAPIGLTGATQASRYVGATASGAPVSGTFAVGDYVIDRTGKMWICTIAGSPGTWVNTSGSGGGIAGVLKLRKTAVQNITTGAWRTIMWDVEDYDNLNAFDIGVSASNITVPSGITLARCSLFASWNNNSNSNRYLRVKRSTDNYFILFDIRTAANEAGTSICGGWIPVTAGDVFTLDVNSGTQNLNFGDGTFPTTYPQLTIEWASSYASLHG